MLLLLLTIYFTCNVVAVTCVVNVITVVVIIAVTVVVNVGSFVTVVDIVVAVTVVNVQTFASFVVTVVVVIAVTVVFAVTKLTLSIMALNESTLRLKLSVTINFLMQIVVMLNVIILNVGAPFWQLLLLDCCLNHRCYHCC